MDKKRDHYFADQFDDHVKAEDQNCHHVVDLICDQSHLSLKWPEMKPFQRMSCSKVSLFVHVLKLVQHSLRLWVDKQSSLALALNKSEHCSFCCLPLRKAATQSIISRDWDFTKLGIGGLDKVCLPTTRVTEQ